MGLKMFGKCRPFCVGLNVLMDMTLIMFTHVVYHTKQNIVNHFSYSMAPGNDYERFFSLKFAHRFVI